MDRFAAFLRESGKLVFALFGMVVGLAALSAIMYGLTLFGVVAVPATLAIMVAGACVGLARSLGLMR